MKENKVVECEKLNKIYPSTKFLGKNIVEEGAELTNCVIENCTIKSGVKLENVVIKDAKILANTTCKNKKLTKEYFNALLKFDNNFFDDIKIVLACQDNEAGGFFKDVLEKLHANVEYLCLGESVKFENVAEVCARYVKKLSYNLGFVIGENSKKIFAVNENGEILNGDEILFLLTWWFRNLNKLESPQVCGSVLTNAGIEKKFKALNVNIHRGKANEKFLMKDMLATNSKLGALQSGEIYFQNISQEIENDTLKIARILLTIYYENANIWKRVKENKFLQIHKTYNFDEKIIDKKILERNLKIIIDFYRLKIKNKGRIEFWLEKTKVNLLIESSEKTLNFVIFKEINKKIKKLLK